MLDNAGSGDIHIEDALKRVLDGDAVLFAGAGFSRGAVTLRDSAFKTAGAFAEHLSSLADLPAGTSLDVAAEEFAGQLGEDRLITELQDEFTVKQVAQHHTQIAKLPWKRIYTTNYDNVLETAFSMVGKRLTSVTLSDDIRNVPQSGTLCVHLNGYVHRISRANLWSEIKLADTSYITASIAESPWAVLFRQDLEVARAIFFVGYSMADLDIRRLVYAADSLIQKSFFFLGEHPDGVTLRRIGRFGTVVTGTAATFAREVHAVSESYTPQPANSAVSNHCIHPYELPREMPALLDRNIFELLLYGDVKPELIYADLHGESRYFLYRNVSKSIIDQYSQLNTRALVIHSELGNGKTLALEGIKCRMREMGYEVYTVVQRSEYLFRELETILQSDRATLLY